MGNDSRVREDHRNVLPAFGRMPRETEVLRPWLPDLPEKRGNACQRLRSFPLRFFAVSLDRRYATDKLRRVTDVGGICVDEPEAPASPAVQHSIGAEQLAN